MLLIQAMEETAQNGKTFFDWMQHIAVPVIVVVLPVLLGLMDRRSQKKIKAVQDQLTPNGSGHKNVVDMLEDVLYRIGQTNGRFDAQKEHLDEKIEDVAEELKLKVESVRDNLSQELATHTQQDSDNFSSIIELLKTVGADEQAVLAIEVRSTPRS